MTAINNTGSTLTVPANGVLGEADFTGTIVGGTVINAYPTLDFGGATLQDLLWQGTLAAYSGVLYYESVTVQGLDGSQGTIVLGNATLAVDDGTLDNVTLRVTGSTAALYQLDVANGPILDNYVTVGGAGTITVIDPGATLDLNGYWFTNKGTIDVAGTIDALVAHEYEADNTGLIQLSGGAVFEFVPDSYSASTVFVNSGWVTVATGASLVIGRNVAQFDNTGTIILAGPGSTLELDANVTTPNLGNVGGTGGVLSVGGTLDNTGHTVTLGAATGFGALTFAGIDTVGFGTIVGGTVVNAGTVGLGGAGVLNDVAWQGTLIIGNNSANPTNIILADPNDLQPAADSGPRNVRVAGWGGNLFFGTGHTGENDVLTDYVIVDAAVGGEISGLSTLTLGSTTTISVVGGTIPSGVTLLGGTASGQGFGLSAALLSNDGLIDDTISNAQSVSLGGGIFDNVGTIQVSGADSTLVVNAGSFVNSGTMLIRNDATLWLNSNPGYVASGPFINTGLISLDASSTLEMAGSYTTAMLRSITTAGGAVTLTGTLDNTGDTITVAPGGEFGGFTLGLPAGSGNQFAPGGTTPGLVVTGGKIVEAGGNLLLQNVTLDGVTLVGPLDLTGSNQTLALADGSSLLGTSGTIEVTGTNDSLSFSSSTLVGSSGKIELSGANDSLTFDSTTLTGPAAVVDASGAGDTVTFAGTTLAGTTVNLGAAGGTVTFDAGSNATLAASVTLDVSTPSAGLTVLAAEGTVVNQGLIDDTEGSLQIGYPPQTSTGGIVGYFGGPGPVTAGVPNDPFVFDNRGTVLAEAGPGTTLIIDTQTSLTNEGLIRVDNNERLLIDNVFYASGDGDITWPESPYFSNSGTLSIGSGTIEFAGSVSATGSIAFTPGEAGTLILDMPGTSCAGPFLNVGTGDRIEFGGGMTISGVSMIADSTVDITFHESTGVSGSLDLTGVSLAGAATALHLQQTPRIATLTSRLPAFCLERRSPPRPEKSPSKISLSAIK